MASEELDKVINETVKNLRSRDEQLGGGSLLGLAAKLSNGSAGADALSNASSIPQQLESLGFTQPDDEIGPRERLFWILLFSLMVLIAAGGNMIVIYIVSTTREMKSVTNYFLVNLSLADWVVSTLNVIFNFISMLNSHWSFGGVYCKISNFIAILSISASVFTLTAISCDRPRMSHRHALCWILLIWTLSSSLALPNIIYSTVVEDRLTDENIAKTCTLIWPDGRYPLSSYDHIYNIIILVVTYLFPISTMAILYYQVGKELWGYEAIGENVEKQARALMAKKKIVKMMIVVVIIFALCWLPYHAFFVVNYYMPTILQDGPLLYKRLYLAMYWLAMSNSMYNPVIIFFMNSKFRHEIKRVLCFICCCKIYLPPIKNNSSANHAHHYTSNAHASLRQTANAPRRLARQPPVESSLEQTNYASGTSNGCLENLSRRPDDRLRAGGNAKNPSSIEVIVTRANEQRQGSDNREAAANEDCDSIENMRQRAEVRGSDKPTREGASGRRTPDERRVPFLESNASDDESTAQRERELPARSQSSHHHANKELKSCPRNRVATAASKVWI